MVKVSVSQTWANANSTSAVSGFGERGNVSHSAALVQASERAEFEKSTMYVGTREPGQW